MSRPPRRPSPSALLVALALPLAGCDAVREVRDAAHAWHGTRLDPAAAAPPLALTTAGGRPFDLAAERGRVALVFFGYTRCPDVCPTTLAEWARTRAALGADTARVRFVFVSVDPARDTPDAADAYAKRFHPAFVGLSGAPTAIAAVARAWSVAAPPVPAPDHAAHGGASAAPPASTPDGAMLAHTAHTFAVGPDGRLRVLYGPGVRPDALAADVRQLLD